MKSLIYSLSINIIAITIFSCALVSGAWAENSNPQNNPALKEQILTAIEKKYSQKSFEADFIQISRLEALETEETASGHALFKHPGKMRWQYLLPEQHEIITNGKSLWIYRPAENQVMIGDASDFFKSGAGGAFLSDISLIRKNFSIYIQEDTPDHAVLNLTATKKLPDISAAVIRVSKPDYLIEKVITYNEFKDSMEFEFTNIKFNPVNPEVFEFKPPTGINLIEMDK